MPSSGPCERFEADATAAVEVDRQLKFNKRLGRHAGFDNDLRRWYVRRCASICLLLAVSGVATLSDSQYENCTEIVTSVSNAVCDIENNIESCEYDGGDCCPSTCDSTESTKCTTDTRECINPEAEDYPYAEFENCTGTWRYINDSICDRTNNRPDCGYDGGDCCPSTCGSSVLCPEDTSLCIDPDAEDFGFIGYETCMGYMPDIGNGRCNPENNNAECDYDGGDCCECTCEPDVYICVLDFDCVDPSVTDSEDECNLVEPCSNDTKQQWVIQDTAGAAKLAQSIKCSGGVFNVEWREKVIVNETIRVTDRTTLNITGSWGDSTAMADGNNTVRILVVINATLHLENMQLAHGSAVSAGALFVQKGNVTLRKMNAFINNTSVIYGAVRVIEGGNIFSEGDLTFADNTCGWRGAAISLESSSMHLAGKTTFKGNQVDALGVVDGISFGGALYASDESQVSWSGQTTFVGNLVTHESVGRTVFCYGGAVAADGRSSVSWTGDTSFVGNRACYGGGALYANSTATYNWEAETFFSNNGAENGGAVRLETKSKASWSGVTTFNGSQAGTGGAFSIVEGSSVTWTTDTVFSGNNATSYGGAVYVSGSSLLECSGATHFEGNTASEGGVLYIGDGPTVIWNGPVNFISNVASFRGGAIYAVTDNPTTGGIDMSFNAETRFLNNSGGTYGGAIMASGSMILELGYEVLEFELNQAGSTGGAVLFTGVVTGPTFHGSRFVGNKAQIGGAVYATGTGTVISATGESNPLTFDGCNFTGNVGISTGGAVETVAGSDFFVNTSFIDNGAKQGGALRLAGTASIVDCHFEGNLASENGGPAISNVGYNEEISSCNFVGNDFNCDSGFFLHFEEGERLSVVCLGCGDCESCTVYDNSSYPICKEAFDHTESAGGGVVLETLTVDKGYWRAAPTSWNILECYNQDACLGGLTGSAGFCATGYEGPYCAVCSPGYAESLSNICNKCSDSKAMLVAWLVVPLVVVLGLVFLGSMVSRERGTAKCECAKSLKKLPLQSIKIIIVAWQILTEMTSVANISFPTAYEIFLSGADLLNFDVGWVLSAGCFINMDFHDRLITCTVGPAAAMGLLALTYKISLYRNRGSGDAIQKVRGKHVSMALWITLLVYSTVSSTVFQTFSCETLDDGESYLRADYSISCRSLNHRRLQVYAAFMIIVYPVGIPLAYAGLLFAGRDALKISSTPDTNKPFVKAAIQLSSPYRPGCFYFEVVECARRVTLTGAIVFVLPNEMGQVAVTLLLTMMFALWSESLAPYRSQWDSWIARTGHVVVLLSVFVAFLSFYTDDNGDSVSGDIYGNVLVAVNVCWIIAIVLEGVVTTCSGNRMPEIFPQSASSAVAEFSDIQRCNQTDDSTTYNQRDEEDDVGDSVRMFERPRFRLSKTIPMPAPRQRVNVYDRGSTSSHVVL